MAIPEGHRNNFETLRRAFKDDSIALMECTDAKTGKPVFVVCASNMTWNEEMGEPAYEFIPIARMFDGNPYEEVNPPESEFESSEGDKYVCDKDKEEKEEGPPSDAGTESLGEGGGDPVG
ncbi:hypothetical protein LCGC14_0317620 [marine sediment metagenome]|uniref:Uncharacterized protein n=1 Tax=marine sediment metagenome TaxID=412755 RepID=A0A0F9WRV9_9ZZZZ